MQTFSTHRKASWRNLPHRTTLTGDSITFAYQLEGMPLGLVGDAMRQPKMRSTNGSPPRLKSGFFMHYPEERSSCRGAAPTPPRTNPMSLYSCLRAPLHYRLSPCSYTRLCTESIMDDANRHDHASSGIHSHSERVRFIQKSSGHLITRYLTSSSKRLH